MAITFIEAQNTFYLDGKGVTYAIMINKAGYPCHMYFGASITHDGLKHTRKIGRTSRTASPPSMDSEGYSYQNYLPEYAFFGTGDFREPAVIIENPTGDRICDLLYDSYDILDVKPPIDGMPSLRGAQTLVLHLKDKTSNIGADLYYTVYDDCSVKIGRAHV